MIELYCEMDTKNVIRLLDTEKEVFAVVPTSIQKYKDGSFKVFFQYEYDNKKVNVSGRLILGNYPNEFTLHGELYDSGHGAYSFKDIDYDDLDEYFKLNELIEEYRKEIEAIEQKIIEVVGPSVKEPKDKDYCSRKNIKKLKLDIF